MSDASAFSYERNWKTATTYTLTSFALRRTVVWKSPAGEARWRVTQKYRFRWRKALKVFAVSVLFFGAIFGVVGVIAAALHPGQHSAALWIVVPIAAMSIGLLFGFAVGLRRRLIMARPALASIGLLRIPIGDDVCTLERAGKPVATFRATRWLGALAERGIPTHYEIETVDGRQLRADAAPAHFTRLPSVVYETSTNEVLARVSPLGISRARLKVEVEQGIVPQDEESIWIALICLRHWNA